MSWEVKRSAFPLQTGTDFSYPVAEGETVETFLHAPVFSYAPVLPGAPDGWKFWWTARRFRRCRYIVRRRRRKLRPSADFGNDIPEGNMEQRLQKFYQITA